MAVGSRELEEEFSSSRGGKLGGCFEHLESTAQQGRAECRYVLASVSKAEES